MIDMFPVATTRSLSSVVVETTAAAAARQRGGGPVGEAFKWPFYEFARDAFGVRSGMIAASPPPGHNFIAVPPTPSPDGQVDRSLVITNTRRACSLAGVDVSKSTCLCLPPA